MKVTKCMLGMTAIFFVYALMKRADCIEKNNKQDACAFVNVSSLDQFLLNVSFLWLMLLIVSCGFLCLLIVACICIMECFEYVTQPIIVWFRKRKQRKLCSMGNGQCSTCWTENVPVTAWTLKENEPCCVYRQCNDCDDTWCQQSSLCPYCKRTR